MFQRYVIPGIIATIATFVGIVFVEKEYTNITRLLDAEIQLDTDLADAEKVEQKRADLMAQYKAFPEDVDRRLRGLLPESVHPARLILDVQAVAERNGLRIEDPNTSEEKRTQKDGTNILSISISFNVLSTYGQLRTFLEELEKSLTLRSPVKVSITTDPAMARIPELSSNPILNVKLKFESYAFPGSESGTSP